MGSLLLSNEKGGRIIAALLAELGELTSPLSLRMRNRLPIAFYLKLFGHEIPAREKAFAFFVIVISVLLSAVGTVWAFLPKSLIGAEPSTAPELR